MQPAAAGESICIQLLLLKKQCMCRALRAESAGKSGVGGGHLRRLAQTPARKFSGSEVWLSIGIAGLSSKLPGPQNVPDSFVDRELRVSRDNYRTGFSTLTSTLYS